MPFAPTLPRASCFIDGQNLYFAAREAFGYDVPDYEPVALTQRVCRQRGWALGSIHFYAGIPSATDSPHWHDYWTAKLGAMGHRGIHTCSRPLSYQQSILRLPDGETRSVRIGREKGIDVRIALDIVRLARQQDFDVAVVFSQDQDLGEVALEIRAIAVQQSRWIKIASAFPIGPGSKNSRGINRTDWIRIEKAAYDMCREPTDFRRPR